MPIEVLLLFTLKTLLVGLAVTAVIACLTYAMVVEWFKMRAEIVERDNNNIAFTLQEKLREGKVKTVQGIFNKKSNTLVDSTVIQSNTIDSQLAELHSDNEIVIYQ